MSTSQPKLSMPAPVEQMDDEMRAEMASPAEHRAP
jgi:hypothetical protein